MLACIAIAGLLATACGDDTTVTANPVATADATADGAVAEGVGTGDVSAGDVSSPIDSADSGSGADTALVTDAAVTDAAGSDGEPVGDADTADMSDLSAPQDLEPIVDAAPDGEGTTPDDVAVGTDATTPDDVAVGTDATTPDDVVVGTDAATPDDVAVGTDAVSPDDATVGTDAVAGDDTVPTDGGGDAGVNGKPSAQLCNPCNASAECGDGGVCVSHGDVGSYCGQLCKADADCPVGFVCKASTTIEKQAAQQCVPAAAAGGAANEIGACTCSDDAVAKGLKTACVYSADGKCKLNSTASCAKAGDKPSACAAVQPSAEVCNGLDDNCDGATDEPIACDDKNACTTDKCDAATSKCVNSPSAGACDADGDECSEGDACSNGVCAAGKAKVCADDNNPCTDDVCVKGKGCVNESLEGKPCIAPEGVCATGGCQAGKCVVASGATCNDKNPCTNDTCNAKTGGCVYTADADGAACDDGSACSEGDACVGGKCAGKAAACDDGNPCTKDGCDETKGCGSVNADGNGCEDGDLCTSADACKDGKCGAGLPVACTSTDSCSPVACDKASGQCVTSKAADGGACDDTNACTQGDSCGAGVCGGKAINCDDGNSCTDDQCNPAKGCAQAPNSDACEDGNACTAGDACVAGVCKSAKLKSCDDSNTCTADTCDSKTGDCANAIQSGACDDGKVCSTGDACVDGVCAGTPDACDDSNPCTTDSCDLKLGCQHVAGAGVCDDGDACTVADTCTTGKCGGIAGKIDCDDKNLCTSDACDPKVGCVHANNAQGCDDGNACTDKDFCKDGSCQAGTALCSCKTTTDCAKLEDGNLCNGTLVCDTGTCKVNLKTIVACGTTGNTECQQQQCEAVSGKCGLKAVSDGSQCNADNSVCTVGDACAAGICAAGKAPTCDDKNACTKDGCDAIKGCVFALLTGPVCDDGSQCTATDTCKDGKCSGVLKVCDDSNVCTTNGCDPASGCTFAANTAPCSDLDACTLADTCKNKACAAGTTKTCSDNNVCTSDSCAKATGACSYALADGTTCTDGSACTTGDKCLAAKCVAGVAKVCNDNQGCTADSCNTSTGACVVVPIIGCGGNCAKNTDCLSDGNSCTNEICDSVSLKCAQTLAADGTPCTDNSACTTLESCSKGKCIGGKITNCDDTNSCTVDLCLVQTGACVHNNQAGGCQDGNPCTTNDSCAQGSCQAGAAVTCNDNNPCTADACDKTSGKCANTPIVGCTTTCAVDADCPKSSDPCVLNLCDGATKKCASKAAANLTACDDGSLCTGLDLCVTGKCVGQNAKNCNDSNVCTDDLCDAKSGQCAATANAAQCSDGSHCTGPDTCAAGKCAAGPPKVCDDKNVCTTDTCTAASGACVFTPIGGCGNYCFKDADCKEDANPCTTVTCNVTIKWCTFKIVANDTQCDDGNACSAVSFCKSSICQGGNFKVCNDSQVCTSDSCDTKTGNCLFTPLSTGACTDNVPCTIGDVCSGGKCAAGTAKVCNDGNACTTDACDKVSGACTFTVVGGCGNYCYANAECKDDGNVCTSEICDVKSKQCTHPAVSVPTNCTDNKPCTTGDACKGGVCQPTAAKVCTDNNACTADLCEPNTGNCMFLNQDGKACDDGVPCTVAETCQGGKCGGINKNCNDGKACTADSCDAKSGVCLNAVIVGCGGNCAVDSDCKDDGSACSVEFCNATKKCDIKSAIDGVSCNDGLVCTGTDVCKGGACAGTVKDCSDNNVCTDDKCEPSKGVCFWVNNAVGCEDGNPCTSNDHCSGGKCSTGLVKNCDDGKKCTADSCDAQTGKCVNAVIPNCN